MFQGVTDHILHKRKQMLREVKQVAQNLQLVSNALNKPTLLTLKHTTNHAYAYKAMGRQTVKAKIVLFPSPLVPLTTEQSACVFQMASKKLGIAKVIIGSCIYRKRRGVGWRIE